MDREQLLNLITLKVSEIIAVYYRKNNLEPDDICPRNIISLLKIEDNLADFIEEEAKYIMENSTC
jgi:hypothetical protein